MASNTTRLLSSLEKTKLQAVLPKVHFVNNADCDQYRCCRCGQVALYHYIAICKHIFCAKCHGQFCKMQCPIGNCSNSSIVQVTQSMTFELEVYALTVYCKFRQNGCKDTIALADIVIHERKCKYSSKNLLPKLWVPPKSDEYTKQLEEGIAKLRTDLKDFSINLIDEKLSANNNLMREEYERMNDQRDKALSVRFDQLRPGIAFDIAEQMIRKIDSKTEELKTESLHMIQNEIKSFSMKLEEDKKDASAIVGVNAEYDKEKILNLLDHKIKEETDSFKKIVHESVHQNNMAVVQLRTQVKELIERTMQESKIAEPVNSDASTISTQFDWKVPNWKDVVLKSKDISSDVFTTIDQCVKMKVKICFIKAIKMSSVFTKCVLCIETVEDPARLDSLPAAIYYHRRTFVITSHSDDTTKRQFRIVQDPSFGTADAADWMEGVFGVELFNSDSGLQLHALDVEDIEVRILIEPLSMLYKKCFSKNGVLLWDVGNYAWTKNGMTEYSNFDYLWSEYFYSVEGYRMKVRLAFSENSIFFYLHVVHGEFDGILAPPGFLHVNAAILDVCESIEETPLKICSTRLSNTDGFKYYLGEVDCRKLETTTYLKNDSIILKVLVEKVHHACIGSIG